MNQYEMEMQKLMSLPLSDRPVCRDGLIGLCRRHNCPFQHKTPCPAERNSIKNQFRKFAERRTNIFGSGMEETAIGEKIEEKRPEKATWDGHTARMEARTARSIEDIRFARCLRKMVLESPKIMPDEKQRFCFLHHYPDPCNCGKEPSDLPFNCHQPTFPSGHLNPFCPKPPTSTVTSANIPMPRVSTLPPLMSMRPLPELITKHLPGSPLHDLSVNIDGEEQNKLEEVTQQFNFFTIGMKETQSPRTPMVNGFPKSAKENRFLKTPKVNKLPKVKNKPNHERREILKRRLRMNCEKLSHSVSNITLLEESLEQRGKEAPNPEMKERLKRKLEELNKKLSKVHFLKSLFEEMIRKRKKEKLPVKVDPAMEECLVALDKCHLEMDLSTQAEADFN